MCILSDGNDDTVDLVKAKIKERCLILKIETGRCEACLIQYEVMESERS